MTLLRKVKPDWSPSEKRDLKVGETIEVTDPKSLIISGAAVALRADGTEISAYEMYGVLTDKDKTELQEFLALKRQNEKKVNLEKENAELKSQLEVAPEKLPVPSDDELRAKRIANLVKAREAKKAKAGK